MSDYAYVFWCNRPLLALSRNCPLGDLKRLKRQPRENTGYLVACSRPLFILELFRIVSRDNTNTFLESEWLEQFTTNNRLMGGRLCEGYSRRMVNPRRRVALALVFVFVFVFVLILIPMQESCMPRARTRTVN